MQLRLDLGDTSYMDSTVSLIMCDVRWAALQVSSVWSRCLRLYMFPPRPAIMEATETVTRTYV